MDRPIEGWNREYEKNFNRIFRKSKWQKIKDFINDILVDLLLKEIK